MTISCIYYFSSSIGLEKRKYLNVICAYGILSIIRTHSCYCYYYYYFWNDNVWMMMITVQVLDGCVCVCASYVFSLLVYHFGFKLLLQFKIWCGVFFSSLNNNNIGKKISHHLSIQYQLFKRFISFLANGLIENNFFNIKTWQYHKWW